VATLCAPVSFDVPRSHARLASLAALMVPEGWRIPSRQVLRALSPAVDPQFGGLCCEVGGPELRAWMVHCGEDLPAGLVRQVARWLLSGTLCDRHDRLDYVAGMEGVRASLLALVAGEDPLCPAEAARPAVAAMLTAGDARLWDLGPGWSHLDVLIGKRAETEVHQPLARWFSERRGGCWTDTGLGSKGR
jgi:hypothetical protein